MHKAGLMQRLKHLEINLEVSNQFLFSSLGYQKSMRKMIIPQLFRLILNIEPDYKGSKDFLSKLKNFRMAVNFYIKKKRFNLYESASFIYNKYFL